MVVPKFSWLSYILSTYHSDALAFSGKEAFTRWLENPTEPNTTLSWNVIQGKTQKNNFCVYCTYADVALLLCRKWYDYAGNILVVQLLRGIG